jgi:hypothetical protein
VVASERPVSGSVSTEHVADPSASVCDWHRGLPSAVKETNAPTMGDPSLVKVAVNSYCVPVPDRDGDGDGADTLNVVGAWPTDRTVSTVLDWKSDVPEYVAVTV